MGTGGHGGKNREISPIYLVSGGGDTTFSGEKSGDDFSQKMAN